MERFDDDLERRIAAVVAAQVKDAVGARAIADGVKLALHELADTDTPTLKRVITAVLVIFGDGANRWVGGKLMALAGASIVGFLLWLAAKKW